MIKIEVNGVKVQFLMNGSPDDIEFEAYVIKEYLRLKKHEPKIRSYRDMNEAKKNKQLSLLKK